MSSRISIVGAGGRVGSALCRSLSTVHDVRPIVRLDPEEPDRLAARAVADADLVVNAAGVAHLERPSYDDLARLTASNVALPLALAHAALGQGVPMLHVSSVKAAVPRLSTAYAASKREADERLRAEFAERFAAVGLGLLIVRPLALLYPPFDAGRVRMLRFLRWWPNALTPRLPVPALSGTSFERVISSEVDLLLSRTTIGFSCRTFERDERATLRDVRRAMSATPRPGGR